MRKYIFVFGLTVVLWGFGATEANAQVSTQNVLKRLSAVVEKLEGLGAQVLFIQVDAIKQEQLSTQTYALQGGSTYAVVAVGDEDRIQDIDLAVADEAGDLAGKDTDDSNLAVVKFKSSETQTYKFGVKGYKMNKKDGFFAIVVARLP